jgi:hypothetical protein
MLRRASARFASGRLVDARFVALRLTESCIGCHSRLPSDEDAPFASKLIDDAKLGALNSVVVLAMSPCIRRTMWLRYGTSSTAISSGKSIKA